MNTVKTGEVYTASKARSGKTEKGSWEMISVTDERGHNAIAVFVSNRPSGVCDGGQFRIDEITGVTVKTRKDERGAWWTDVSVNASVTAIEGAAAVYEGDMPDFSTSFDEIREDTGELPF